MRLSFDLCAEEKDFIAKRKKYVAAALKNVLQLKDDLQDDEVRYPDQSRKSRQCGSDGICTCV